MPFAVLVTVCLVPALVASVVVAVRRSRAERQAGSGLTPGLKGWLLVLAAILWLSVPRVLAGIADLLVEVGRGGEDSGLLLADAALSGVAVVLVLLAAVLLTQGARTFLAAHLAVVAWTVLYLPLVVVAVIAMPASPLSPPVDPWLLLMNLPGPLVLSWALQSAGSVAWHIYARRSRRVALTCVR